MATGVRLMKQYLPLISGVAEKLRVTEIMYHPAEPPAGDPNAEFIELKNMAVESLNLNLVRFTNGIQHRNFNPWR